MSNKEDYEQKYKEALERAKYALTTDMDNSGHWAVNYIFPELKESEGDRIKWEILEYINSYANLKDEKIPTKWIEWLEKQGEKNVNHTDIKAKAHQIAWETSKDYDPSLSKESWCEMAALDMASWFENLHTDPYNGVCFDCYGHRWGMCARDNGIEIAMDGKPVRHFSYKDCEETFGGKSALEAIKEENVDNTNKVEPKFKVGDWIITPENKVLQITSIEGICYRFNNESSYWETCYCDEKCRLLAITDAKPGDVLAINWHEGYDSWEQIIIFVKYHNEGVKGLVNCPCVEGYGNTFKNGKLAFHDEEVPYYSKTWTANLHPATKEQRDLLFQTMKEVGYGWDSDKKELNKQTLKITPKFCVGQLITDDNGTWYKITNIKCLDVWYYVVYDVCEDSAHHELCSFIDERFRENRFEGEIKNMDIIKT